MNGELECGEARIEEIGGALGIVIATPPEFGRRMGRVAPRPEVILIPLGGMGSEGIVGGDVIDALDRDRERVRMPAWSSRLVPTRG